MNTQMSQVRRAASGHSNSIARGRRAAMEAVESRVMMSVTSALPGVTIGGLDVNQTLSSITAGTVAKATGAVITAVPLSLTAGGGAVVTVHLADATGTVDLTRFGTVNLSIATGPAAATLGGTVSVAAVNGVATFPHVVLTEAGDYTLRATAAGLTAGTSADVKVTAGAAAQLAVISQPVLALLGQAVQPVVVAVEDIYGNVVTTANSVVTLAAQTTTATTSGAITAINAAATTTVKAVNGVATFSDLTIKTAGTSVLTATATTLATARSAPVTVTVPSTVTPTSTPTASPVAAPIATILAGAKSAALSVDVSASLPAAAAAHTKAGQTVQVSVTRSADGSIALSGTLRVKAGLAVLPKVNLHVAGTYSVVLTDASGATVTQSIVIAPSAAAKLVFTRLPSLLNDKATVAVEAVDKWGNLTTMADGSTVTLSLGHGSTFGKLAALAGATTATLKDGVAAFTGGLSVAAAVNPGGYAKLTASLGRITVSTVATYTIA